MENFWPSSKNKANLENLIHQDAMLFSWGEHTKEVVVSAYGMNHGNSIKSLKLLDGSVIGVPNLDTNYEEADQRLALHAINATKDGFKRLVIISQDTDVLILFLHHLVYLSSFGNKELWITAGVGDTSRYIPVHTLAAELGETLCQILPAIHTLTGCDYTSKFGTKAAALKANPEQFLKDFGNIDGNIENQVTMAEQYLVKVKKSVLLAKHVIS